MQNTHQGTILVASDIHYGLSRNSSGKLSIIKDYVEPSITGELEKLKGTPTTLVICGDLFHEMVSVRTDIYKEAKKFLVKCVDAGADVILLAGNHDCYEDTTDITSVEMFEQIDGITVFRFPAERELYGRKCLFLPWSDNNEYAFRFEDGRYDCVFCHPDVPKEFFSGLYVLENSRRISATEANKKMIDGEELLKSGLEDLDYDNGRKNDRIVSNLESVRKVICLAKEGGDIFAGHIHKHSESVILGRNFRFIGSPYQTTSEEMDSKSGFYIMRGDTRFVEIAAPEFVKIRFSDVKREGVDNYDFSFVRNNIVQLDGDDVITVELEAKMKRRIMENAPFEVSTTDYSNLVTSNMRPADSEKYEKAFATSPKHCLDMYIDSIGESEFEKDHVSRDRIKDAFDKLYDLIDRREGTVESDGGAHIRYHRIEATNFLSYEKFEFDFEKYKGLTLIYGKNLDNAGATNACGKSNIIKAISYALFGRFPNKVKKENMLPWNSASRDVNVTIYLESNGVEYRIDSGVKKGRDSYHRVYNLSKDADITKKQLAETRKMIETDILHCSFDMFMKTTILTSSEIFNFYSMKKEDKDDYLNTIFGTKTIGKMRDELKNNIKGLRNKYLELNRLLDSKEHDIQLNKDASEKFESTRSSNIAEIGAEIERLKVKMDEIRESESPEDAEKTRKLENELSTVNKRIKELNSKLRTDRDAFASTGRQIAKDTSTIDIMSKELLKHKDVVPKLCDTCKKVVADGYNLSEYAKTIKSARAEVKTLTETSGELRKAVSETERERDQLVRKSMELESRIKQSKSDAGKVGRLETLIESKKSTMEFIRNQTNPNEATISAIEKDRDTLQKQIDELYSKIAHLDFLGRNIVSQEVVTNLLTSKFIKHMNERIRYYLQRLGLNLGVEFDDDFHYEFIRGNGAHPEFNSLSGGECLRIVIATSFAFKDFLESRRNITTNIRFLDEFFEKDTDNLGMNSTIAILKDFSSLMNQNVFLISNKLNEIDNDVFDNVLLVTIENDKSSITEERVSS